MKHVIILLLGITLVLVGATAPTQTLNAQEDEVGEEMLAQGQYLATISGCIVCHSPLDAVYDDLASASLEDLQTLALFEVTALDSDRLLAGGRPFDLGPAGVILTPNLTPDETGIGDWTREELKAAIQLGVTPEGRQLHPIMPSHVYVNMADADLDAIVEYLFSLEPIANEIPDPQLAIPPRNLESPEDPIVAPDPSDLEARAQYLMTGVLPCTECHTALDPDTGAPVIEEFLAGGQPYEGPWGIAYAANITPHEETGVGTWTDNELITAIIAGVRPDGRRLVLMPWQDYASLTLEDTEAMIYWLRNAVEPIEKEIPDPSLNEGFEVYTDD